MPPAKFPITKVRFAAGPADQLLSAFTDPEGRTALRAPRGIAPAQVQAFLQKRLGPQATSAQLRNAHALARFYEKVPPVAKWQPLPAKPPATLEETERAFLRVRLHAEFGTAAEKALAATFVQQQLLPLSHRLLSFPSLLQAAVDCSPQLAFAPVLQRLQKELAGSAATQKEESDEGRRLRTLADLIRNEAPAYSAAHQFRDRLLRLPAAEAAPELVRTYLQLGSVYDKDSQEWSARRLRAFASRDGYSAVTALLAAQLDNPNPTAKELAGQALLYFQFPLPAKHAASFASPQRPFVGFLWDDPDHRA